jgi:hypothetical protein
VWQVLLFHVLLWLNLQACSVPATFITSLFQCQPRCGVITAPSPSFLMNLLLASHVSRKARTGSPTARDNGKFIITQLRWTLSIALGRPVQETADIKFGLSEYCLVFRTSRLLIYSCRLIIIIIIIADSVTAIGC